MSDKRTLVNILLTALAPAIWGSTYVVTTELLPPDNPLWASVFRALPAGIILLLIGRKLPWGIWWFRVIVLGVLNIGAFFYFLFVAAYLLPGGIAALVMSCQPIFVLLLGLALLGQKLRLMQFLACFVGGLGVALLVLQPSVQLDSAGVAAGLAGAASMATGIVLTKRWGCPENVSILTFTGWQLTAGGLVLVPIALMTEALPETINLTNILGVVYLSLVGTLLAYVLWFRGIVLLPAISVSFLSLISPLAAAILGYVILSEGFSLMQVFGALVIITAVIMAQPRKNLSK